MCIQHVIHHQSPSGAVHFNWNVIHAVLVWDWILLQGEFMFWDKYPVNMYYSTSRRGTLHSVVAPPPDTSLVDLSADWTCIKVSWLIAVAANTEVVA